MQVLWHFRPQLGHPLTKSGGPQTWQPKEQVASEKASAPSIDIGAATSAEINLQSSLMALCSELALASAIGGAGSHLDIEATSGTPSKPMPATASAIPALSFRDDSEMSSTAKLG